VSSPGFLVGGQGGVEPASGISLRKKLEHNSYREEVFTRKLELPGTPLVGGTGDLPNLLRVPLGGNVLIGGGGGVFGGGWWGGG